MLNRITIGIALVCALFSGIAMGISLTHSGPRGPQGIQGIQGIQGEQGNTGQNAEVAHLGVCFQSSSFTTDGISLINNVYVYSPTLTDGVPSCPTGTFISVVPQGN